MMALNLIIAASILSVSVAQSDINVTDLVERLGMMATPLPGNFFTMDKYNDGLVSTDMHPYAREPWFQSIESTSFPAFVRVQSLRQAGVSEALHFIPADAVWSYNGGCASDFLVVRRDLTHDWYKIGPNAADGQVFSVFIGAGEYYAHFNSRDGPAFMTASIPPGINGGGDIITPSSDEIVESLGVRNGTLLERIILDQGENYTDTACDDSRVLNDEELISGFDMMATPLPGNFFTMDKYNEGKITLDLHPYANEPWFQWIETSAFPTLTRVQSLRQAGVSEVLHFLPGDAVWSYNGGYASDFLVIRRDLSYEWFKIGPHITDGQVFSVFIGAGEYYAHFNGPLGSAFMTSAISPGINGGMDIITPTGSEILDDLGVEADTELAQLILDNSKPDADDDMASAAADISKVSSFIFASSVIIAALF